MENIVDWFFEGFWPQVLQTLVSSLCFSSLLYYAGSQTYPNSSFGWVNVKDVANAHIQAFEIPSASGRYCLVEKVAHFSEIVEILRNSYPSSQIPHK